VRLRTVAALLMIGLLPLAGGCYSRLAKEGLGVVAGAKGILVVTSGIGENDPACPLGSYQRFELGKFTDDMGGRAPAELFACLPEEFAKALRAAKIPNARSGKTLLVRGKVIYYEEADKLTDQAFGPLEEVVARVEFVDISGAAERVLAKADCVGRSNATTTQGVGMKAEGLAKALVKWISSNYPKEQRVKEE
jgi:hypothetical protein